MADTTYGQNGLVEDSVALPDKTLRDLAQEFARTNGVYYGRQFERIEKSDGFTWTFNWSAALLGPLWMGARGLPALFWASFFAEMAALVQIGFGLFGNLGYEETARASRLRDHAAARFADAEQAFAEGASHTEKLLESAKAIAAAAEKAELAAVAAAGAASTHLVIGIVLLFAVKIGEGVLANWLLERRFMRWRSNRSVDGSLNLRRGAAASLLALISYPMIIYRFTSPEAPDWLFRVPVTDRLRVDTARWLDGAMEWIAETFETAFVGITRTIRAVLDGLELTLVETPWPIVMITILVLSKQLAGWRVAILTGAALAYLAVLGFWEESMATVALLGTAAVLCILLGIPLGIVCGRNERFYGFVRPVLDFMQTMPAFVYLIPVIALFGIGKPPGIVATLMFGIPPVVRLTALGLQGVPHSVREAALAYGATRWFLLFKVDLPLALPSIMTGINQTILMCLSMVVIASLIGAKGLGGEILIALQYAAVGDGLLAGLAILVCAMVIDRIVQGSSK
jgi:glycine betaine/proline transport system permease protein